MNIQKIGHCCLVIDTKGTRIVTDPGSFTAEENKNLKNVDFVLFTHEHQDHYHLESLKVIIENNPKVIVYANDSLSEILKTENIPHMTILHGETIMLGEIEINGIGEKHAEIHSSIPLSGNIGFMIDQRLWYPGDAFTNPERPVEILALPVSGPWLKISEVIDYALLIKPKVVIPVHDNIGFSMMVNRFLPMFLAPINAEFVPLGAGDSREF